MVAISHKAQCDSEAKLHSALPRSGIFAVYKPKGPSSHDVIAQLRRLLGVGKIGHAGTLDPLAEGVLVVGVGKEATKKLSHEVGKEKEYSATIILGATSKTDDGEGPIIQSEVSAIPSRELVETTVKQFQGLIAQTPPAFSAIKQKGTRAYKSARLGAPLTLSPRMVEIRAISIEQYQWPELELRVVTGQGVYIRALARDIGAQLGVGGYIKRLVRTRVGEFTLDRVHILTQN